MSHQTSISAAELASYRTHVGRRREEKDGVSEQVVGRFAAALDHDWREADATLDAGLALPEMWHYGLFLNQTPTAQLGADGHPPRGEFLPAVRLPRRMFAGADIAFHVPLVTNLEATKISEIISVDLRQGKSGDLVFVKTKASVFQRDALCLEEHQTIVYCGDGPRLDPIVPRTIPTESASESTEVWTPHSVALFRFSAVTFNAHRIHFDLPYATETEGYPGLVVHGPLTALKLCMLARRLLGPLKTFRFRGEAPLFAHQPVRLIAAAGDGDYRLVAERCDGAVAMTASATARSERSGPDKSWSSRHSYTRG